MSWPLGEEDPRVPCSHDAPASACSLLPLPRRPRPPRALLPDTAPASFRTPLRFCTCSPLWDRQFLLKRFRNCSSLLLTKPATSGDVISVSFTHIFQPLILLDLSTLKSCFTLIGYIHKLRCKNENKRDFEADTF